MMVGLGRDNGLRWWLCVLLALIIAGGVSACSNAEDERLRAEEIARAEADGRRQALAEQRSENAMEEADRLRDELEKLREQEGEQAPGPAPSGSAPSPAPSGGGPSPCGGGVSVNSSTSCPFARIVRDAYESSGGSSSIEATSPVTGRTYTMSCSGALPVVCTGGNNAAVYIR